MEDAYFLLPDEALCSKRVCPVIPTEGILAVARRGTYFIGSDEGDRGKQIPRFASG